jgi:hypothetical protein
MLVVGQAAQLLLALVVALVLAVEELTLTEQPTLVVVAADLERQAMEVPSTADQA